MPPRAPSTLPCSCRRLAPSTFRQQSTAASTSSPAPTPTPRIVAAALLSRAPLVLPELTPLEKSYYAYQRSLHRAFNKPLATSLSWFFKKGSAAEASFVAFEGRVQKETGDEPLEQAVEMATEDVDGGVQLPETSTKDADRRSLERKLDRTLYLLLKKDRKENAWQFPQGGVEPGESLVEAAKRELVEETGPDMDIWSVGRVPAGAYTYKFPKEHVKKHPNHDEARVFFLPMRVLRGQPKPNKQEGLVDFAWLTKEEVQETVSQEYWEAVEPILSDR